MNEPDEDTCDKPTCGICQCAGAATADSARWNPELLPAD